MKSLNDSRSIIVFGEAETSMEASCLEELADLKSLRSIEDDFGRILEVDEEYIGSNQNTARTIAGHHS